MLCFTAARSIHLLARIILSYASQHSARTLALSATHYFALERPGDNHGACLSRRQSSGVWDFLSALPEIAFHATRSGVSRKYAITIIKIKSPPLGLESFPRSGRRACVAQTNKKLTMLRIAPVLAQARFVSTPLARPNHD
jgi:hypothetical protein